MLTFNLIGRGPGYVYFIGENGIDGRIKIGWAMSPIARRTQLQTGNPNRLSLLAMFRGSRNDESILHDAFRRQRRDGEWFVPDHDLSLLVIGLGADYDVAHKDGTECGAKCDKHIINRFRSQLMRRCTPLSLAKAASRRL